MGTFRVKVECRHCHPPGSKTAYSCPFEDNLGGVAAGTWCLRAWGWTRATGGNKHWSCPRCVEGYGALAPKQEDMTCNCLRNMQMADFDHPVAQLQVAHVHAQAQAQAQA